jgi:hypothetical protein
MALIVAGVYGGRNLCSGKIFKDLLNLIIARNKHSHVAYAPPLAKLTNKGKCRADARISAPLFSSTGGHRAVLEIKSTT